MMEDIKLKKLERQGKINIVDNANKAERMLIKSTGRKSV